MTRNRKSAKQAGARFEQVVADYLQDILDDDRIERRVMGGVNDRGDISNVRFLGSRVVVEVKDYGGVLHAAEWVNEAQVEAGNDDAPVGVVVAKRRGTTNPAEQYVLMTLRDLAWFLTGGQEQ